VTYTQGFSIIPSSSLSQAYTSKTPNAPRQEEIWLKH